MAVELSGDEVGLDEILNGVDTHEDNRVRFGLPTRLIAKTYLFRLIYGGSAYSYSADPNFSSVSKSEKFWQGVIDETYNKYKGLAKWHKKLVEEATLTGKVRTPFGREFIFKPEMKRGELKWPRTTILNYPVQSGGAEMVQIARISSWRRLERFRREGKLLFINTVHDDIQQDCDNDPDLLYKVCIEMEQVFADIPKNVEKIYGYKMKVPLAGEVSFGWNLAEMTEFSRDKGTKQFEI
jgi:DNA polymerase I-like protein with 3'-5' exonuclease and polymerase domains